jgi:hypothetical protein
VVRPPYHVVVRLVLIAQERWVEIDGEAALKGVEDLMSLRVDRFLNAIYVWCVQRIEPDDLDRWQFQLNEPFPGRAVTAEVVEQEMDAFADFAGAFGVMKPPTG